jgi:hypothetical protein
MQHETSADPPERRSVTERDFAPADTLFDRIRHETALIAAADALEEGGHSAWAAVLRDYTVASDKVLSVHGDADAATLGWLKARGIVSLLVTEECDDAHTVEHVSAALAAMNAVTLTVDAERSERLRPLIEALARVLPDAFAELPVRGHSDYPPGTAAAALTPTELYRSWAAPVTLAGPAREEADRVELLTLYGRLRQLDVRPE